MKLIDAKNLDYKTLNEELRQADGDCTIDGCCGQRFIAAGMSDKTLIINGIPGNALGAYLNNANITVNANAQDAVGDTMNEGKILIHGITNCILCICIYCDISIVKVCTKCIAGNTID